MKCKKSIFILLISLLMIICHAQSFNKGCFYNNDTCLMIYYKDMPIAIKIKKAKPIEKAVLLVLPGWNYSDTGWCKNTNLCDMAEKYGYTLIFIEMKKSIYAARYYPESNKEYARYPTRTWLKDSVFTILQNQFGLLLPSKNNFVVGLSTGGRGAVLLALDCPKLFKASATLSGDFDPTLELNDPLMNGVLGSYKQFPKRWMGEENVTNQLSKFKVPLYIGHGKADKIVSVNQSIQLYLNLKKVNPALVLILNTPDNMGHNYQFWGSELNNIFQFFENQVK